jgi:two-component system response regulator DegU
MKLLIVDDNAGFRALLRAMLADLDWDVTECADGEEAVAEYSRNRPDKVLMDLRMQPGDGLTALRAIMARDRAASVLIVTSYDDDGLRRAAREAGACGYATKDDLLILKRLLTRE